MSFQQIIQEADVLASRCLCHSWSETETVLLKTLPQWQKQIVSFVSEAPNGKKNIDINAFQTGISQALGGISQSMKQKNAVLLSNTLADLLIPTLKDIS